MYSLHVGTKIISLSKVSTTDGTQERLELQVDCFMVPVQCCLTAEDLVADSARRRKTRLI